MVALVGGVPVADVGTPDGALVHEYGQVQYGRVLFGSGSAARVRELIGWRDLPDVELSDSPRPQAHGSEPGLALAGPLVVTGVFLVRGTFADKMAAVAAIEAATQPSGTETALVVQDTDGAPALRMARVIARTIPQERHFRHSPAEVSVQWLCADPKRYDLTSLSLSLTPLVTDGGLEYPLEYPVGYGTSTGNNMGTLTNAGTTAAPVVVSFLGPMTDPGIATDGWSLQFALTLADGETLTVDTAAGTVRLNGDADRLYTITPTSDPVDGCLLPPGDTSLRLAATSETGTALVSFRPTYL